MSDIFTVCLNKDDGNDDDAWHSFLSCLLPPPPPGGHFLLMGYWGCIAGWACFSGLNYSYNGVTFLDIFKRVTAKWGCTFLGLCN